MNIIFLCQLINKVFIKLHVGTILKDFFRKMSSMKPFKLSYWNDNINVLESFVGEIIPDGVFKIVPTWVSQMEQALSFIAIIRFIIARTSVITLIIARASFELDYMISIAFGNASCIRLAVENTISQLLFF